MKKYFFLIVMFFFTVPVIVAQDLNQLMVELSKMENIDYVFIDSTLLKSKMEEAKEADPSRDFESEIPSFMKKIKSLEVANSTNSPSDLKEKMMKVISDFKDKNGYETLLSVEEDALIRIIAKRDKELTVSDIYIAIVKDNDVIMIKFTGDMNDSDLKDIVNGTLDGSMISM